MNSSLPLRTLFLQHVAQTSPFPPMLEVEKASGVFIFDTQGKRYFDFISGISVSNVGHCNPHVIKAIQNNRSNTCMLWCMANLFKVHK